jgi:hypothetical protein
MTTYQDQPLSRRQIREREAEAARSAEAAASGAPVPGADAASPPAGSNAAGSNAPVHSDATPEPLNYVTQGRAPLPQYDAPVAQPTTPPATAQEAEAGFRYRDFSPEGRRAARHNWPPAAEPADLDYRTQNRPEQTPSAPPVAAAPVTDAPVTDAPHPDGTMSRRELRALREAHEREQQGSQPPVAPAPQQFASQPPVAEPLGSQAPLASAPPLVGAPPVAGPPVVSAPPAAAEPVQASDAAPSWLAPFVSQQDVASAPPASAPPAEAPPAEPTPPAAGAPTTPPPLVEPADPQTDAVASLEAFFRAQSGAVPIVSEPTPAPTPEPVAPQPLAWEQAVSTPPASEPPAPAETVVPPWGGLTPGGQASGSAAPVAAPPASTPEPPAPVDFTSLLSAPPVEPAAPQPATGTPPPVAPSPAAPAFTSEPAAAVPLPPDPAWAPPVAPATSQPTEAAEAPASTSQPPTGERPRNHWSRQAELDDEAQPPTGSLSRDVGVGSATANALVLPEIPNPDIIVSSVRSTGDILVTGSISLPASLSSTGALPAQLDESDLDNLLDPGDQQVVSTDSQPVRAARAVSTHTSSREIIGAKPKRSNRALTTLIVAAAGMAVVVVTLLVVALTQGVLN